MERKGISRLQKTVPIFPIFPIFPQKCNNFRLSKDIFIVIPIILGLIFKICEEIPEIPKIP